ncbi:thiamine pyrophosphate-dependent enzyme [Cryomorphaceae bacterium 1068]|nr:thiamine pyrophosphate-dependent enzyme [Cryomorphaceae bacterium 1068]
MTTEEQNVSVEEEAFIQEIITDYKLACESREASLLGRKEVLTGKAKFGIFGDGKELAQIAMAKQFQNGDFRSGYYRDQTFMMAIGALSVKEAFAGLYAHPDPVKEPASAGRQMGGHFSTRNLDENGNWKNLTTQKNSSADISPTAGQMPRLVGLAQASKIYRKNKELHAGFEKFSNQGNEVAFGTIGDASTSEGVFWESINAAGVLQIPMVMSVWDDGYGISVPKKYQTTKGSISEALKGFQRSENSPGYEIFKVRGWDYVNLIKTYEDAVAISRKEHVPVLIHVEEVTQPQGHSTSGSHERYKSKAQLEWAKEHDCIVKFKTWILEHDLSTEEELEAIAKQAKKDVRSAQKEAWKEFQDDILTEREQLFSIFEKAEGNGEIRSVQNDLKSLTEPLRKDLLSGARKLLYSFRDSDDPIRSELQLWIENYRSLNNDRYSSHLYSESEQSPLKIGEIKPTYDSDEKVDGRIVLRDNFAALFKKYPEVLTFGEDVGKIGGVNQSMEGMQEAFGEIRVSDTGIREATIIGQGIGMAMRGLRPIAEIQYLDYLLYALQIMSDDLATVQYRTKGGQKAPLIVRTRGHRLEGVWHSGSPMGAILGAIRGIHICVPRNMTTAAGMFNTLLQGDDPALVVEPLNAYRSKERLPSNLSEYKVALGIPEIVKAGTDLTIVSYGSTFNIVEEAVESLSSMNVDVELIDARTLLPFDKNHMVVESLKKTNRLMIVDEDVPGGASAFLLDKILNEQDGYFHLDSKPITLSAKAHRPAYGTDGDYFSKPNHEDIVEAAYGIMHEFDPFSYPPLYN